MELQQTQHRNLYRPHHIYDGHCYFVTGRCLHGEKVMKDCERRRFFQKKLGELAEELRIGLLAWSVLENHYHVLFLLKREDGDGSSGVMNASSS